MRIRAERMNAAEVETALGILTICVKTSLLTKLERCDTET